LLDASKAFDRIKHSKLFDKLFERKVPVVVIRWLVNLYTSQYIRVSWNFVQSDSFSVGIGVKRGYT
jgi:Reverse transcriptase (RNA-dependent DNA polymerase)